jgi:hypothetical protein
VLGGAVLGAGVVGDSLRDGEVAGAIVWGGTEDVVVDVLLSAAIFRDAIVLLNTAAKENGNSARKVPMTVTARTFSHLRSDRELEEPACLPCDLVNEVASSREEPYRLLGPNLQLRSSMRGRRSVTHKRDLIANVIRQKS